MQGDHLQTSTKRENKILPTQYTARRYFPLTGRSFSNLFIPTFPYSGRGGKGLKAISRTGLDPNGFMDKSFAMFENGGTSATFLPTLEEPIMFSSQTVSE